jgi:2-dehydropantoate 2-reductase
MAYPEHLAVLGPGGVGGWVAAALASSGRKVTVVAKEATVERIAAEGIQVRSAVHGDYTARPAATAHLREAVDALIVASKGTALESALERIEDRAVADAVVLPLLNGLDHMEVLRGRFPGRVIAGVIRIESDRPEPGEVVQTSPTASIEMASDGDVEPARIEGLARALEAAGIPVEIGPSEAAVLWGKLVRLNALAVTSSATDRTMGFIRNDPEWRAKLVACIEEACAVARAEGVEIPSARVVAELEATHDSLTSSMQRDISRGQEPELDQIPGAIIRAGARHGIACPTIEELVGRIRDRLATAGRA